MVQRVHQIDVQRLTLLQTDLESQPEYHAMVPSSRRRLIQSYYCQIMVEEVEHRMVQLLMMLLVHKNLSVEAVEHMKSHQHPDRRYGHIAQSTRNQYIPTSSLPQMELQFLVVRER